MTDMIEVKLVSTKVAEDLPPSDQRPIRVIVYRGILPHWRPQPVKV